MNGRSENELNKKLVQIIHHAYKKAPTIKQIFQRSGIRPGQIKTIKDLELLPTLSKEELMEWEKVSPPFGGFVTIPIQNLERIFVSPGPIFEPHQNIKILANMFYIQGFRKGDVVINAFNYHLVPAGILFDSALRSLGITVIAAGVGNTELMIETMQKLGVTGFIGLPSFLISLIEKAQTLGYDVKRDFMLRIASLTAEMLPSAIRNKLESEYGINVRQFYGAAEVGTIAYECSEAGGMHLNEQGVVVEIIDPETNKQLEPGEKGEIVVTSLSKVFPLVRFRTGDLSFYSTETCKCGSTSLKLKDILGRVGQAVKVRGLFLHPKELEKLVAKVLEINKLQAIIDRSENKDNITLRCELYGHEGKSENELIENIRINFQEICRLKVDKLEFVKVINENEPKVVDKRVWA